MSCTEARQIKTNREFSAISMLQRLCGMRNEQECSFKIRVEGQTIFAHRDVLVGASDYFKGMLTNGTEENQKGEVDMQYVEYEILKKCIDFIYGCDILVLPKNFRKLMTAADMLCLEGLCNDLEHVITESLNVDNFFEICQIGEMLPHRKIKDICRRFAEVNITTLSRTPEFYDIDKEMLVNLVESDRARTTEKGKLDMLSRWMDNHPAADSEITCLINHLKIRQLRESYISFQLQDTGVTASCPDGEELRSKRICIFSEHSENLGLLECDGIVETSLPKLDTKLRCSILTFNSFIYAIGPQRSLHRMKYNEFNPVWEELPTMTTRRGGWPRCTVVWGDIYVIGGGVDAVSDSVERFDPDLMKWEDAGSTPTSIGGSELVALEDHVICFGGMVVTEEYVSSVTSFNVGDLRWEDLSPMREERALAAAAISAQKHIIIAGGENKSGFLNSVEFFDIKLNQWTQLTEMNVARWAFKIYAEKGCYISVGGRNNPDAARSFEQYTENDKKWKTFDLKNCETSNSTALIGF